MEFPSYGSSPKRSQSSSNSPAHQQVASAPSPSPPVRAEESTASSSQASGGNKNAFSKFFTQLKNLIAEAATIEPTSDVSPGVDHCCKTSRCHYGLPIHHLDSETLAAVGENSHCSYSTTSSSKGSSQVSSRLIVYRDCDRRGRKILFDSEHVSADYVYLKPTDPKLLKELGEYVFGCVPLASTSNAMELPPNFGHKRFCKWKLEGQDAPNKTLYIWSKIFELGSCNRNNGTKQNSATTVDYSSSSSEHSSSGYDSGSGAISSSSARTGAAKTFSLPLFNQKPSSQIGSQSAFPQTRSLPGRIDSYKTNLALVWILSQKNNNSSNGVEGGSVKIPFPYLSPLIEKLMLNPLSNIAQNFYHNGNHFATSLKNISTTLNHDLTDFLTNPHVVNLSLVKPPLPDMVNAKLVCKFLELILTNMDSCVVLNLKKWTEVKGILYFLKMFLRTCVCKCNLLDSRRESLVETGTDVISLANSANELDCVDSGIESEGSSSRLHAVSSSSMYQSSRKWSIVSEEDSDLGGRESSHDGEDYGRVSFHLGDVDVDQSEAKLALGEIDLSRLKRGERRLSIESTSSEPQPEITPSPIKRPPLEVKLSFSDSKLKDSYPIKYTPCYYCNGTYITAHNHFNPFYFCQIMAKPSQVSYDMEYVNFMKIIELYGSGATRTFNLGEDAPSLTNVTNSSMVSLLSTEDDSGNELIKKIKDFVDRYVQLAKVTNDNGKLDSYVTFQMEEIYSYIS